MESELKDLDETEAAEYLESLGAKEGGLKSLIRATYRQLGLRTYFTTGLLDTLIAMHVFGSLQHALGTCQLA